MFADGGVTIKTGAMDIGTGTKTVACMVAAEELGLPLENIRIENADTAVTPYAQNSGGSMTLPGLIPAVRRGAWIVKRQIFSWAAEALRVPVEDLELKSNTFVSRSAPDKKRTLDELMRANGVMDVIGIGNRDPNPANKATMPFAAHFAEVEVNTKTGEVKVVRLLAANESGRVINRKTFDNQVFGGMTMGLGYALDGKAGAGPADRKDVQRQPPRLQGSDGARCPGGSSGDCHRSEGHGVQHRRLQGLGRTGARARRLGDRQCHL